MNAFQVFSNDDPFLLCTAMTHTNQQVRNLTKDLLKDLKICPWISLQTTKANTCYTGGVRFLQRGDELHVRDLESGRNSVLLPSHTFFGAIQLTAIKMP